MKKLWFPLGAARETALIIVGLSQDDTLLLESSHFTFVYDDPEYSLVVLNAGTEHSGVYTCTAKNLAGSNSCKAELTVHAGLQRPKQ